MRSFHKAIKKQFELLGLLIKAPQAILILKWWHIIIFATRLIAILLWWLPVLIIRLFECFQYGPPGME